jgi:release factor glutamine methyltransferase
MPLNENQLAKLREFVKRRVKHEPLQYILGEAPFCGFMFKCDKRALIPRPETELLVQEAINYLSGINKNTPKILEIGTGSGCIAIALSKSFPDSSIIATDIHEDTLALAGENAKLFNAENITFIKSDFLTDLPEDVYDIVISNPPYIPQSKMAILSNEILDFEPHNALTDFDEGLKFYHKFAEVFDTIVNKGTLFLEIDGRNTSEIISIFPENKFQTEVIKDLSNLDRIIKINSKTNSL